MVAASTTGTAKEIIVLSKLLHGIVELEYIAVIQIAYRSTVNLAENLEVLHRTKLIKIKKFFIIEKVVEKNSSSSDCY